MHADVSPRLREYVRPSQPRGVEPRGFRGAGQYRGPDTRPRSPRNTGGHRGGTANARCLRRCPRCRCQAATRVVAPTSTRSATKPRSKPSCSRGCTSRTRYDLLRVLRGEPGFRRVRGISCDVSMRCTKPAHGLRNAGADRAHTVSKSVSESGDEAARSLLPCVTGTRPVVTPARAEV